MVVSSQVLKGLGAPSATKWQSRVSVCLTLQDTNCRPNPTCGEKNVCRHEPGPYMVELTQLLKNAQAGDPQARDALFAAAYPGLQQLARARLRDGGRNTVLDTRSLVHESYLRYVQAGELRAEDRRSFFAYASQVMRSVIVNNVREREAQKRGSGWRPVTLSTRISESTPDG